MLLYGRNIFCIKWIILKPVLYTFCSSSVGWNLWEKNSHNNHILHCIRILFTGGFLSVMNMKYFHPGWLDELRFFNMYVETAYQ